MLALNMARVQRVLGTTRWDWEHFEQDDGKELTPCHDLCACYTRNVIALLLSPGHAMRERGKVRRLWLMCENLPKGVSKRG